MDRPLGRIWRLWRLWRLFSFLLLQGKNDLDEVASLAQDEVDGVGGDAQHRRQRQAQADQVAPPRVRVVEVRERLPARHVKEEHALAKVYCFC